MEFEMLKKIGLTSSEINVYTVLLKSGSSKVGELMKQLTLHRSRVYEAINRLMEKGLVSYAIRNNVKFFEASDPEMLVSLVEEQKAVLEEKEKLVKKIVLELKKQAPTSLPQAETHVFTGKEGFKTIRKDVLKQREDLYLVGAVGKEDKFLQYFFPNFNRLRIKQGIKFRVLYDAEVKGKKITKLPLMETKFLPDDYSSPAVINIYADKVVNVIWKNDIPTCFMIINKEIADSYRKWFALLWKNAN